MSKSGEAFLALTEVNIYLNQRVEELEQAFRHYASHDEDCTIPHFPHNCSCGYREVLRGLKQ